VGDVVLRLTDDGVITWVSDSVEQALGAPADHWTNRHFADFGPPGQREDGPRRWSDVAGGRSYMGRRQVFGPDGTQRWIHLRAEPFYDAAGRRDGIVASFRVIDSEVALEDAAREGIDGALELGIPECSATSTRGVQRHVHTVVQDVGFDALQLGRRAGSECVAGDGHRRQHLRPAEHPVTIGPTERFGRLVGVMDDRTRSGRLRSSRTCS